MVRPVIETRVCEWCGDSYDARHPRARFCRARCRYLSWTTARQGIFRSHVEEVIRDATDKIMMEAKLR